MIIGSDMMPLMTGQVDVVTGWITNTTALKVLGAGLCRHCACGTAGVRLYALPYYATADTLTQKPTCSPVSSARRPAAGLSPRPIRDKAVELLVQEYPNLVRADELAAAPIMFDVEFTAQHQGPWLGHHGSGGVAGADRPVRRARAVHQAARRSSTRS